jgi:hypothetical protein
MGDEGANIGNWEIWEMKLGIVGFIWCEKVTKKDFGADLNHGNHH